MPHDAFISYGSANRDDALEVCAALEQAGLTCWIAPRDIPPAVDYGQAITDAITQSRVVVLLVSEASNTSPQVRREMAQASGLDLPTIPYRIEDVQLSSPLRYYLSGTQWLDAPAAGGRRQHEALIDAVRKHSAGTVLPTAGPKGGTPRPSRRWDVVLRKLRARRGTFAAFAAVLLLGAGLTIWSFRRLGSMLSAPPKSPIAAPAEAGTTGVAGRSADKPIDNPRPPAPAPRTLRFKPGCPLPFAAIAVEREISFLCGVSGKDREPAGTIKNLKKNFFCAAGPAEVVTFEDLVRRQSEVDRRQIPYGNARIAAGTTSRAPFESIGEGKLVRLVGLVQSAHFSDVRSGETVNCSLPGTDNNDIHLALAAAPGLDPCASITAEISPHYRPESWNPGVLERVTAIVRVSGQLFFDDDHLPCRVGTVPRAKRASECEIHPVYGLDVCRAET